MKRENFKSSSSCQSSSSSASCSNRSSYGKVKNTAKSNMKFFFKPLTKRERISEALQGIVVFPEWE